MFLGRIITKSKKIEVIDLIEVCNDTTNIIDDDVPTLIIGKKVAESIYGKEKIKLLDKNITKNVSWTFGRTEKRTEYERSIALFQENVFKIAKKKIKYIYFNIFIEKLERVKSFIRFMRGNKKKYIYITHNQIYIYCENAIIGISLDDIEYCGVEYKKIIDIITKNENNIVIDNKLISNNIKDYVKNETYLIPYLYFIIKE